MNPCKCGYLSDRSIPYKACFKAPKCGNDYQMKISGPIMDRFDLQIEVGSVNAYNYNLKQASYTESSSQIAERVERAREIQQTRYDGYNIKTNNRLDGQLLIEYPTPC